MRDAYCTPRKQYPDIGLSKIEFIIFTNHSEDDEMGNIRISICGNLLFFFPFVFQPVHNMMLISTELCTLNEALNKIFYENKNE